MNSYLTQIRNYLKSIELGQTNAHTGQTHMMELFTLMKSGLDDLGKIEGLNYTHNSLVATVKFADKKLYEIVIKEVKL